MSSYFYDNNLLSENQYGFRREKNTELACLSLIDRVLPAFVDQGYAICVFLDFSACFDTVDRTMALEKMHSYGVRGAPLELIKSYFTGRCQRVKYRGNLSNSAYQDIGVIQGSKMGPLFFDIYSNDINMICDQKENILFADDTCLIYFGVDLERLVMHVNS